MIVKTIKSQEKGGGSRENVSAPIGGSGGRVTTKWYDTKRGCVSIEVFIILLLIGVLYACHFMAIRYMPPTPPLQYVNVTTPCGVYIGIQQHNMYTFKGNNFYKAAEVVSTDTEAKMHSAYTNKNMTDNATGKS